MDNTVIKKILDFSIPDGMREMTAEETASYFTRCNEGNFGIRNEENHTIIGITAKKRPVLLGRAASLEAELKATEKNVKKQIPTYESLGYSERNIDGQIIKTFRFRYVVQGFKQIAEYCLYRSRSYFCAFQLIYREEFQNYAEEKFEEFISSIKLK